MDMLNGSEKFFQMRFLCAENKYFQDICKRNLP